MPTPSRSRGVAGVGDRRDDDVQDLLRAARSGANPPSSPSPVACPAAASRFLSAAYTSAPARTASAIDGAPSGEIMNSWKSSAFGAWAPPLSTLKLGTGSRGGAPKPGSHACSGFPAEAASARDTNQIGGGLFDSVALGIVAPRQKLRDYNLTPGGRRPRVCPLSGVKRTCGFALQMSAYDPKRALANLTASVRW